MLERLIIVLATAPPTTEPIVAGDQAGDQAGFVSSFADVVSAVIDNLGNNGYQTGYCAGRRDRGRHRDAQHRRPLGDHRRRFPIGAFWAGWLGWNTLTAQDNPLFPGDVSATKLWDVAFAGDTGFLLVVIVACVAAVFLWRKSPRSPSRLWLLLGAVLGASFVYNLVEAVRVALTAGPCRSRQLTTSAAHDSRRRTCCRPVSAAASRTGHPPRRCSPTTRSMPVSWPNVAGIA